jgi:polysaccharide export outer membrane protein
LSINYKMTKKQLKVFLLSILLGIQYLSFAQTVPDVDKLSDQQIEKFLKEAESRGMSEMQIEAAARANGYSTEDIIKVRERIAKIKTGTSSSANVPSNTVREQLGEVAERAEVQVSTADVIEKKANVFGHDLFKSKNLNFEPNLRLPTPLNYILGPDDELSVDITGYAYQHYSLRVSPEGTVKIESLAPIYINGLSIEKAREKILQKLKMLFGGLANGSLNLDVTLAKVRTIKVSVVGAAENPGTYSVSSLATVFHALYVSGGPSSLGTFREVQLIRNNRILQSYDVYEFLVQGILKNNLVLQDQDVIFIPLAEKKVQFVGQVIRPMIFELRSNENFSDALKFAGGFTENAYKSNINLHRFTDKEKELINLSEKNIHNFALKNGDKIEVNNVLDRYTNKVQIMGAVFRPGEYALGENIKTVSQLIALAEGLREDAFKNRALLRREQQNKDPEYIALDLNAILNGEDFPLQREDQLIVKSLTELREVRKVKIQGAINQAGEYDFADNMTVNDLITLAGGLQEGATVKRIEVARRLFNDELDDQQVEIIAAEGNLGLNLQAKKVYLKPFDLVFVRELPNYQAQELVSIEGEVNYPGTYAIKGRNERISDLIERAGGQRPEAYFRGAKFYRDGKQVAVNLEEIINNINDPINLFLENNDRLIIPKEAQTVKISGQVLNPTQVAYQNEFDFKEYISQAGGYTDSAFVKKSYVRYANGLTDRTRTIIVFKKYPRVEKGMEIIIPIKRREKLSKAEIISISSGFVSLSAVLLTLFRLL